MSHLGHEQVPTLPMVGVGDLMHSSGGRRGRWRPSAPLLPRVQGDAPGRPKEPAAELCKWM